MNDYKPGMKKQLKVSLRPDEVQCILWALSNREAFIQAQDWRASEKAMALADVGVLKEGLVKVALEAGIQLTQII